MKRPRTIPKEELRAEQIRTLTPMKDMLCVCCGHRWGEHVVGGLECRAADCDCREFR